VIQGADPSCHRAPAASLDHGFNGSPRTRKNGLDRAIAPIAHPALQCAPSRFLLDKGAVSDTLDLATHNNIANDLLAHASSPVLEGSGIGWLSAGTGAVGIVKSIDLVLVVFGCRVFLVFIVNRVLFVTAIGLRRKSAADGLFSRPIFSAGRHGLIRDLPLVAAAQVVAQKIWRNVRFQVGLRPSRFFRHGPVPLLSGTNAAPFGRFL